MKPILFYHGNCPDGFGSAFAFWKKFKDDIEYYPLVHADEPFMGVDKKIFKDRDVYMLDISFERKDSIYVNRYAKSFTNLDHHISAQNKLIGLDYCHFDMKHSGAVLGWNYCFPDITPPKILQYIEDRDLWQWKLPYAKELLAAIDSYGRSFEEWERLDQKIESPEGFSDLIKEGVVILRYNESLMKRLKDSQYTGKIKGFDVPIINTPFFRSEMLNELAKGHPFAAGYHYDGQKFIFSLRSSEEGEDVSLIALKFPGGGGHRSASGFAIDSLDELE